MFVFGATLLLFAAWLSTRSPKTSFYVAYPASVEGRSDFLGTSNRFFHPAGFSRLPSPEQWSKKSLTPASVRSRVAWPGFARGFILFFATHPKLT